MMLHVVPSRQRRLLASYRIARLVSLAMCTLVMPYEKLLTSIVPVSAISPLVTKGQQ